MKKITILMALVILTMSMYGQRNDVRYVWHFSGGLSIGGVYKGATNVKIDSLILDAGVLKFYSGGVEVPAVDTTNLSARIDSMLNKTGTAWRVLYRNTSGLITELALGADGTYLKSNGATSAPTFATPTGSGDVSKVGTPVDNQVGVWTGDGTLEGTTGLTYDGSNLQLTGDIGATGTRITKGWFTDLQVTNAIAGAVTGNAGTVTGYTPASGSLTLAGADAITFNTSAATNVTLPVSGLIVNKQSQKATLDSLLSAGEAAVALPDSNIYNGGYQTPRGADIKLALKANLASPTFTGTVVVPSPFTLGATSVTANGTELNVLDNIPGTLTSTELGYVDGVTSAIQTQLDSKANIIPDTVAVTDNYTLVLTDNSKRIRALKATSMTVTLPPNASVAFAKETTVYVQQLGAGPIVFKPGAGVKIYSEKDSVALNTQYRWAAVIYWGNDNYQIVGTTD